VLVAGRRAGGHTGTLEIVKTHLSGNESQGGSRKEATATTEIKTEKGTNNTKKTKPKKQKQKGRDCGFRRIRERATIFQHLRRYSSSRNICRDWRR
jgi:hypothetical protein